MPEHVGEDAIAIARHSAGTRRAGWEDYIGEANHQCYLSVPLVSSAGVRESYAVLARNSLDPACILSTIVERVKQPSLAAA